MVKKRRAKKRLWTEEAIRKNALLYSKRGDWLRTTGGAYRAAKKLGIFNECVAHMEKPKPRWTPDRVREVANGYTVFRDFQLERNDAYQAAKRFKMVEEISAHMKKRDDYNRKPDKRFVDPAKARKEMIAARVAAHLERVNAGRK